MDQLSTLLGTRSPLIQAPMAGVQDHQLAAAVSQAGALGSLPCAMYNPEQLADEISSLRALTSAPFNLNFFCHQPPEPVDASAWHQVLQPYYEELGVDPGTIPTGPGRQPFDAAMLDVVEACRPRVVSFHFGLPEPAFLQRVKATGAVVMSSATTVEEACWLEQHGADAIIAQGLEAGGHRGHFLDPDLSRQSGSFTLLPQVKASVSVPVIAAGGIADVAGIRAALALGADGVQIGTAYLLCHEAKTSQVHRDRLRQDADAKGSAAHTALTNVFSGRPARGLMNRLMRELGPMSATAPPFPLATAALAPLRRAAEQLGRDDFTPLWAGQNTSGCRDTSARDLTDALMSAWR